MANRKHCPYCHATHTVKIGFTSARRQRYKCKTCRSTWTNKPRPQRLHAAIWRDFVSENLCIAQLSRKYNFSKGYIRKILTSYQVPPIKPATPVSVIAIDATYFNSRSGVLIAIDAHTSRCLYCAKISGHETLKDYSDLFAFLDAHSIHPKACILDSSPRIMRELTKRGLYVQYCQFHQIRSINRLLPKSFRQRPTAELRNLAKTLTYTKRSLFATAFSKWLRDYQHWLTSRIQNPDTNRLIYAHREARRAAHSIKNHFPYLFTAELHPELHIPPTNNLLEGLNSAIKLKLSYHRGARNSLKLKIVYSFLSSRIVI